MGIIRIHDKQHVQGQSLKWSDRLIKLKWGSKAAILSSNTLILYNFLHVTDWITLALVDTVGWPVSFSMSGM